MSEKIKEQTEKKCPDCKGRGWNTEIRATEYTVGTKNETCSKCNGTGKVQRE